MHDKQKVLQISTNLGWEVCFAYGSCYIEPWKL